MPTIIPPAPGRNVWFHYRGGPSDDFDFGAPHAAIIAKVYNERLVNLAVFNTVGRNIPFTSVQLVQEGDPIPNGSYCTWMPYQLGQARKTVGAGEAPQT